MAEFNQLTLGKSVPYTDTYSPQLLDPIPRALSRNALNPSGNNVQFNGCDLWTAYEVSWLNAEGKPQIAVAEFRFDAASKNIVESKSFKYYLNSLNQTQFGSWSEVSAVLNSDLSQASEGAVMVELFAVDAYTRLSDIPGDCVDGLSASGFVYTPEASLLTTAPIVVRDVCMYSHLLKSNCPVTGQPDWATVWVQYSGKQIIQESFLKYVVSFRAHQDFHENCVEIIFTDILRVCAPQELSVYARYTRRGGLDINPFRTTKAGCLPPRFHVGRQ